MTYKDLQVVEEGNLKIISNDKFVLIYNMVTEEIILQSNIKANLSFTNGLNLNVKGDFDITVDGQTNLFTTKDFAIDSKTLWLNSGVTKQYINLYWEELEDISESYYLLD